MTDISDRAMSGLVTRGDAIEHATVRKSGYARTVAPDAFITRDAFDRYVARHEARNPSAGKSVFVIDGATPTAAECRTWAAAGYDVRAVGRWPIVRGDSVTFRWLPSWTGRAVTEAEAEATWSALVLGCGRFVGGAPLASPGATGVELWRRTIPEGVEYPTPVGRLAQLLRATASQGRIEILPPLVSLVPGVYEYDSRLAYLGCLSELPHGPVVVDRCAWATPYETFAADLDPYSAARLLITWEAPRNWHRCGIFRQDKQPNRQSNAWRSDFPLSSDGPAWADHAEVRLAVRFGWRVDVLASVRWASRCSPFRRWLDILKRVMASDPAGVPADVWRNVWRAIALQMIGSLHGSPVTYRRFAADGPPSKEPHRARPDTAHPEWTSAIWTRARLRLLDAPGAEGERVGAWHLPAPVVLGLRTDALYTTQPTGWADDGRIGRYRLKRAGGPRPWPLNEPQLLEGLQPCSDD